MIFEQIQNFRYLLSHFVIHDIFYLNLLFMFLKDVSRTALDTFRLAHRLQFIVR